MTNERRHTPTVDHYELRGVHRAYTVEFVGGKDHKSRTITVQGHPRAPEFNDWLEKRGHLSSIGLPQLTVPQLHRKETQYFAETWRSDTNLELFLEGQHGPLSELSSVYLTLQIASTLKVLSDEGIPMAPLSNEQFALDTQILDLPRVIFLGVLPTRDIDTLRSEAEMFPFVSRVLYQCLTGSLPPSEQASALLEDEGNTNLGFDDLLMNWTTEDTELGPLGTSAINTIHNVDESRPLTHIIESLHPHLKSAAEDYVEQQSRMLKQDQHLLNAVRMQRGKLKELRTRHRYLTGWLMDQNPEIDQQKAQLKEQKRRAQHYAGLLERLGQCLLNVSPSTSLKPMVSDSDTIGSQRLAPVQFSTLPSPDLPPELPKAGAIDVSSRREAIPLNKLDESLPIEPQHSNSQSNSVVSVLISILVGATVLGVLFAWSLLSGCSSGPTTPQTNTPPIDSK